MSSSASTLSQISDEVKDTLNTSRFFLCRWVMQDTVLERTIEGVMFAGKQPKRLVRLTSLFGGNSNRVIQSMIKRFPDIDTYLARCKFGRAGQVQSMLNAQGMRHLLMVCKQFLGGRQSDVVRVITTEVIPWLEDGSDAQGLDNMTKEDKDVKQCVETVGPSRATDLEPIKRKLDSLPMTPLPSPYIVYVPVFIPVACPLSPLSDDEKSSKRPRIG